MSKINKIVKSNKINLKEQSRQLLPGLLEMAQNITPSSLLSIIPTEQNV